MSERKTESCSQHEAQTEPYDAEAEEREPDALEANGDPGLPRHEPPFPRVSYSLGQLLELRDLPEKVRQRFELTEADRAFLRYAAEVIASRVRRTPGKLT